MTPEERREKKYKQQFEENRKFFDDSELDKAADRNDPIGDFILFCESQNLKSHELGSFLFDNFNSHQSAVKALFEIGIGSYMRSRQYKLRLALKHRESAPKSYANERQKEIKRHEKINAEYEEIRNKTELNYHNALLSTLHKHLEVYKKSLYAEWLVNKVPLGNCTKKQLEVAAEKEEKSANGHLQTAKFYRKLAVKMCESKTLRECVSESDADKLRASIWKPVKKAA